MAAPGERHAPDGCAPTPGRAIAPLRTARASGIDAVSRELSELHRAMLRTGEDEDRMVRLSVLTLVAACTSDADADRASEVVAAIAAQHPARALIVVAGRERPAGIEADLSLECRIDGPQVCAELVRLRVGGEAAMHLGSVVTPLLLPDVPVHLWLVGAPELHQALDPATLALVEGLVLDSSAYADPEGALAAIHAASADGAPLPITDLSWSRSAQWREVIARAFDARALRPFLAGIDAVEITVAGPGSSAEAMLLDGWLRSRLATRGLGVGESTLSAAADDDLGPGAGRLRSARISASTKGRHLEAAVSREGSSLVSRVVLDGETVAEDHVPAESAGLADLVGAALQNAMGDPVEAAAIAVAVGRTAAGHRR